MSNQLPNPWLSNVIEIVMRHKKTILLIPTLTLIAGALFFVFCPRTYRSEARLFLRIGRETVGIDPTATTGQILPLYTADLEDEVKSAEEIFASRSVASQVVDRLGPDVVLGRGSDARTANKLAELVGKPKAALVNLVKSVDPVSEREEAIITLERHLSVRGAPQATMVALTYEADSPQQAQTICQAVVDVARREYIRVHRSEESNPFFEEQQERLREQLDASLKALSEAKDELGLANVEQRRVTLEEQYKAVELDRLNSNQQLATAQAQIEELQQQLSEVPERLIASNKSVPNQGADMLHNRFYELQVKLMDLQSRYSDEHPLVRAASEQLREAKKVLSEQAERRTETTDEINPIHRELSLAMKREYGVVAGLRARLVELDQQKKAVLADLHTLNQCDLTIDQLTRESELARDKYMQYAQTMEEARIDKELQNEGVSNISVAQAATLAEKPVFPSRGLTVAGTFVLAAAGTIGLVLLGERQNGPTSSSGANGTTNGRMPRRRVRRRRVSKSSGQTEADKICALPK
jgi:uncharacterized protein involved in exopolysaccharide biosynthesis